MTCIFQRLISNFQQGIFFLAPPFATCQPLYTALLPHRFPGEPILISRGLENVFNILQASQRFVTVSSQIFLFLFQLIVLDGRA